MSAIQIILVLIVAAIAGIESVLDEFQFHRPLVACTLVGLILGDIKTEIILGGTLEMMSLGWMNIGAALAPDAAMASVISTMLVINTHQTIPQGIAVAITIAAAGQVMTILARTLSVGLQHKADTYANEGNIRGIEVLHLTGLVIQAIRVVIPTLLVAIINVETVQNVLDSIPDVVTTGLSIGGGLVVVVGYAMVMNMMEAKYLMPFLFLGFVIATFTDFNLIALGITGLVFAIVYIQLHPKYYFDGKQAVSANAGGSVAEYDDLDDDLDA